MNKLLILFILFELTISNAYTINLSKKSSRKEVSFPILKKNTHLRKLQNSSEISHDLYDSTIEAETNLIEIETDAQPDNSQNEVEQISVFTLLAFVKYIFRREYNSFSFLVYTRQFISLSSFSIHKISFTLIISFSRLRILQENLSKNVTCPLFESGMNILLFNCTVPLNQEIDIQNIQAVENSFLFDDIPMNLIISPIGKFTMHNIQKETGDQFQKCMKSSNQLYSLDNGVLSLDTKNKKFFVKNGKPKKQNEEEKSQNLEKNENIEGNYVFPFDDGFSNEKKNITCQLKNNGDETYDAECKTEGAFSGNINLGLGNGVEDNIKDIYLMFNVTNDTVYFPENSISNQFYYKGSSKGLSRGSIALIIIVCIATLICIAILAVVIGKRRQLKIENDSSASALEAAKDI